MNKTNSLALIYLTFALLITACASKKIAQAPDTQPGDQLKAEYLVGSWCTNRDLTGEANKNAGHSRITNISPLFWEFNQEGKWQVSASGWLYEHHGKWQLKGLNTIVLEKSKGKPKSYQANFKNDGADLYLQAEAEEEGEAGKFLVLSGCE